MKSATKLLTLIALATVFGATISTARAEAAFPVQANIQDRQVTATHRLNRPCLLPVAVDTVIQFNNNSSKVPASEEKKLKELAAVLKRPENRGAHVKVQGYTDSKGSDAANQRLSYHRAVQVMHTLVKKYGVPASMLSAQGYGKENPVADNTTAEGRALNRRVTFAIVRHGYEY